MILRVGIDIVEVDRIRRAMRHERFLERILTPAERAVARGPLWVAGRWAAKEAVAKCLDARPQWQDVEVLPGERGEPLATVSGRWLPQGTRVHVSISHERGSAVAMAVLEHVPGT